MALTVTRVIQGGPQSVGFQTHDVVDINIGTYATGGLALDPKSAGMKSILGVTYLGETLGAAGGYSFSYDNVSGKLLVYWTGTTGALLDEVTNSTDLSGITGRFLVIGF